MDGHVVRFYDDDESFDEILIDYIGRGLEAEEACIVVATLPRREGITEGLRARGLHTGSDPVTPLAVTRTAKPLSSASR